MSAFGASNKNGLDMDVSAKAKTSSHRAASKDVYNRISDWRPATMSII